ncbi:hypothetical protein [Caenibius sp. WL]|uniref:hypothetical protein n=1 Tax=Caenibius sp. WL TaxID=2872646 RepID=UPI001C999F00|nr:hypothetical protein [Caenibius sp. WL]QZP06796.1 hypothetical protein K5X80_08650 [Caenibius sp. WL]
MPQDVPLEASETLAFTPHSLLNLAAPPSFTLGTSTHREKRFMQRLMREEGLVRHSEEAIRLEVLTGLKLLWTAEDFETFNVFLTQYWEMLDDFAPQAAERRKEIEKAVADGEEPPEELEFPDPELAASCEALIEKVAKAHRPIGMMRADNHEALDMSGPLTVAVILKGWSGLDAKLVRDRGYLTLDSVYAVKEALETIEKDNGIEPGIAWNELQLAVFARMYLNEELAKNFVSPSLSDTPQTPSNASSILDEDGQSPAPASSSKTQATA